MTELDREIVSCNWVGGDPFEGLSWGIIQADEFIFAYTQ